MQRLLVATALLVAGHCAAIGQGNKLDGLLAHFKHTHDFTVSKQIAKSGCSSVKQVISYAKRQPKGEQNLYAYVLRDFSSSCKMAFIEEFHSTDSFHRRFAVMGIQHILTTRNVCIRRARKSKGSEKTQLLSIAQSHSWPMQKEFVKELQNLSRDRSPKVVRAVASVLQELYVAQRLTLTHGAE